MEVILLEKLPNLGSLGDVVKVKSGLARNFLIPKKLALSATSGRSNVVTFSRSVSPQATSTDSSRFFLSIAEPSIGGQRPAA